MQAMFSALGNHGPKHCYTVGKSEGPSGHDGNTAADKRATWAQNEGSKNDSNISNIMAYLRQQG